MAQAQEQVQQVSISINDLILYMYKKARQAYWQTLR
mgnify:CR=1 FL=1